MREVYQSEDDTNVVDGTLEEMVREGTRRILAAALEEDVNVFLAGGAMRGAMSSADTETAITPAVS